MNIIYEIINIFNITYNNPFGKVYLYGIFILGIILPILFLILNGIFKWIYQYDYTSMDWAFAAFLYYIMVFIWPLMIPLSISIGIILLLLRASFFILPK